MSNTCGSRRLLGGGDACSAIFPGVYSGNALNGFMDTSTLWPALQQRSSKTHTHVRYRVT